MAHLIRRVPLSDNVLREIYSSDQSMYPAPLSYARLQSWVKACPELSLSYSAPSGDAPAATIGTAIVLPLQGKHWRDLVEGKLKEIEIDATTMLTTQAGAEVGLHVFHIEKPDSWPRLGDNSDNNNPGPFAEYVMATVGQISQAHGWNVLGYSGEFFYLFLHHPLVN
ncbi:MAG: hypothetical protein M1840_009123 [Geoglossum simile]|nr:MAG: hypothetical protein M1840_009123 [Geoglossum simile]